MYVCMFILPRTSLNRREYCLGIPQSKLAPLLIALLHCL